MKSIWVDRIGRRRALGAVYLIAALQTLLQVTSAFVVPVYLGDLAPAPSHFVANLAIFTAPWAAGFLLAHAVGVLVDLTGRAKSFILLALTAHLLGFAVLALSRHPWSALGGTGFAVAFTVTLNTTTKTYVTRLSEGRKGSGVGWMILASQIGWFAGSGLAIYFFRSGAGSAPWIIRWDLALILGSLVIVALLLPSIGEVLGEPSNPAGAATLGWGSRGREELRALYADTALRRVGLATLFLVGGNWIFMSTSSVYLVNQLRVPREWIGRVSLIGTVITSALLPFLGPLCDRRGPAAAIRVAAMGYFGCYVALFLWPTLPMAVIVFGAPAYALLLIGLASAASEIGGVARRGGGIGIVDGVWAVAVALGSALGGVLADFRLSWIPAVTLAVVTVGVVIAWSAASRLDRRLAE